MTLHYFDQFLDLEPRNMAALLHMARVLEIMGKTDLALNAYKKILLHKHDHPVARRKVAQYSSGQG
ncbi:MAG: hypothetical protein V3V90_09450 [Thermodesulfobacteriota bacterium]